MTIHLRATILLVLLGAAPFTAGCAGRSSSWPGNIGEVSVAPDRFPTRATVAVVVLADAPPDTRDGEQWAIHLARAFRAELDPHFERTHAVGPRDDRLNNPPEGYQVVVVEPRITEIRRGSEPLRWIFGFGAGSTRVRMEATARVVGDDTPFLSWSDHTGSGMRTSFGGTNSLLAHDMRRLAKRGSIFMVEEMGVIAD